VVFELLIRLRRSYKIILKVPFCLLVMCSSHETRSQADLLRKEIAKIIQYENSVDFKVVPGILIGVIDGDSTFRFVFGKDIYPNGIYEMGSLTKPVVAWLANEALVSLNMDRYASVCTFLPDSLCTKSWWSLTFDEIIGHRTGLMRLTPWMGEIESDVQDPYKDYSLSLLAHDLSLMEPTAGTYSYSHIGYAMTYWLFERVGGLSAFTRENLTGPYSMGDTKWDYNKDEISPGYGLDGRPQPPWNTNALKPAMGLKSSLDDMMKFVRILFDGYGRNRIMQHTNSLKKELKSLSKTGAYKVVDGWFVIRSGKSLVFYHNGRTGGHHVSVAFTPHLSLGVVIISNGALGSNDLSLLILRMLRQAHSAIPKA